MTGIQKNSKQTDLYHDFSLLQMALLIIKGGADGSLLTESEVEKYSRFLKDVTICEIPVAGHELWVPEKDYFIESVNDFLRKLDISNLK